MTEPVHPLVRQIASDYGAPFLRYLFNIEDDADILAELALVDAPLLNTLVAIRAQSPGDDAADFRAFVASSFFTTVDEQTRTTTVDEIRRQRGGSIHLAPGLNDPVAHQVTQIANDIWPALLFIEADGPRSPHGLTAGLSSVFTHPNIEEACQAFMQDTALAKLFPGHNAKTLSKATVLNISAEWILSTGQGGTRQLVMLLEHVIAAAGMQALISDGRITAEGVTKSIGPVIQALRDLANGKATSVKLLVGFSGVSTGGERISLGTGVLRPPLEAESKALGVGGISSVLETSVQLSILSITESPNEMLADQASPFMKAWDRYAPRLAELGKQTQARVDRVRYSVLLASENEETFGMSEVARLVIDPTSPSFNPLWLRRSEPRAETVLSSRAAKAAATYFNSVSELHPKSLDIAMKRILSSASERTDATDAFIDAVIVWENAFGVSTETTFRVTAAIAKLLEPISFDRRSELQKELKELYNARSKLVHGGTEIHESKVWAYRQRSIEIALRVLRILYTDRADLLSLRSDERGARVLLET